MKKLIFSIVILIFCVTLAHAQIRNPKGIINTGPKEIVKDLSAVPFNELTIYSQPNYRGTSGKIIIKRGQLIFPFTDLTNVSIKVENNKIVYLKKCDEFPYEIEYHANQPQANLTGVCGLRSDLQQWIDVDINGISSEIHNNDCKRVYGKITLKVQEKAPNSTDIFTLFRNYTNTIFGNADPTTPYLLNVLNSNTRIGYSNFIFNNNPVPNITARISTPSYVSYCVGASAIRDGRINLLITSKIGSAHKSGDYEDDFSSKVEMAVAKTEIIPINYLYNGEKLLNAENNKLVIGPYSASGSRDRAGITASGGIYKNFRVHLTVNGL